MSTDSPVTPRKLVQRIWLAHHIRTDGGPQFRSEFKDFCASHGIQHELSSPYNPESNGLAEAAVKNLKSIVISSTPSLRGEIRAAKTEALQRSSSSADVSASGCLYHHATWRRATCSKLMQRTKKQRASTIKQTPMLRSYLTSDPEKGCGYSIIKQATVIESRDSGRAYELVNDDGKTYYRGRRFLRPVQHQKSQGEATVFQCYTKETEEFADAAMEPVKPSYSAILSSDKQERRVRVKLLGQWDTVCQCDMKYGIRDRYKNTGSSYWDNGTQFVNVT